MLFLPYSMVIEKLLPSFECLFTALLSPQSFLVKLFFISILKIYAQFLNYTIEVGTSLYREQSDANRHNHSII